MTKKCKNQEVISSSVIAHVLRDLYSPTSLRKGILKRVQDDKIKNYKCGFTKPSRGMSTKCESRTRVCRNRAFDSKCERFRLSRGAVASSGTKAAFTLAEVLITLAIVGVVAALTLPNLIADYQKKQTVTQLKRVYTTFANAFEMAKVDHGDYGDWEWEHIPTDAGARSQYFMNTYVFPYLSVVKKCIPSTTKECFVDDATYLNDSTPYHTIYHEKHVGFILKDGTTVEAWAGGDGYIPHFIFWVDINGFKKPNKFGKDIFSFRFGKNTGSYACGDVDENEELINEKVCVESRGLSFEGIGYGSSVQDYLNPNFVLVSGPSNNKNKMSCTKNGNGRLCGAAIYINNWEIPEGYPW